MAEVRYYVHSPIFPLCDVDQPGLRLNCFDRGIFQYMENTSTDIGVVWTAAIARSTTSVFFFNVLYSEIFEVIFHPSDEG
jgi:hypothetical protein